MKQCKRILTGLILSTLVIVSPATAQTQLDTARAEAVQQMLQAFGNAMEQVKQQGSSASFNRGSGGTYQPQNERERTIINHVNRGVELFKAERLDEAEFEFVRALELEPSLYPIHLAIALIKIKNQDWSAASYELEQVIASNPRSGEALFLLAAVSAKEQNTYKTIENLRQAFSVDDRYRILVRQNPTFDFLRGNAEFEQLMNR